MTAQVNRGSGGTDSPLGATSYLPEGRRVKGHQEESRHQIGWRASAQAPAVDLVPPAATAAASTGSESCSYSPASGNPLPAGTRPEERLRPPNREQTAAAPRAQAALPPRRPRRAFRELSEAGRAGAGSRSGRGSGGLPEPPVAGLRGLGRERRGRKKGLRFGAFCKRGKTCRLESDCPPVLFLQVELTALRNGVLRLSWEALTVLQRTHFCLFLCETFTSCL